MSNKVYLLEDDESISQLVECALSMSNIDISTFSTIKDFLAAVQIEPPAVALLDIMLPDGNGMDVLHIIKQQYSSVVCIMLSALNQEATKVKGLNAGADDYIEKPFGVLELTARVNVALRRHSPTTILTKGDLSIDCSTMTVTLKGVPLSLNNKEFALLKFLMENENRVLTRDALLNNVWQYDEGETRTVDNHIARLRKLGIDCIQTVFGVGYKFSLK